MVAELEQMPDAALPWLAWARLLSPLSTNEEKAASWRVLDIAGSFKEAQGDYWNAFQVGSPPAIPLLFHAMLQLDGNHVREDWLRVMSYLELTWKDSPLPPDQLAIACDIQAMLVSREEVALSQYLLKTYFTSWLHHARQSSANYGAIADLLDKFGQLLEAH